MEHVLIITGGHLNMEFAENYRKTLSIDKVFAVDKGLEYADQMGIIPDYLIGDFDTVDSKLLDEYERRIVEHEINTVLERHPVKKDASDTELALHMAMSQDAKKITILGGTGSRLDHVFANIGLLLQAEKKGVEVYIVDECNRIRLLSETGVRNVELHCKEQHGRYISLIPLTDRAEGVTLEGVMYPLDNASIYAGSSLTVSNQIVGVKMRVKLEKGKMLLIESSDSWNMHK